MLPKGFKNNLKIQRQHIGLQRREDLLAKITDNGIYLPKGVLEEDLDKAFVDYVSSSEGLEVIIEGKKLPVLFLTIQRWSEYTKTWKFTDEYNNIELPFVTIVRNPDIQPGKNQSGLWNIPQGDKNYTYVKYPTWDGVRKGVNLYKIPQPVSIDITYHVRLVTNKMSDLNSFNRVIQTAFQSKQAYVTANGHYMPIYLENTGNQSKIDDFDNRRFYIIDYEIRLVGYILNEDEFVVIPGVDRIKTGVIIKEN